MSTDPNSETPRRSRTTQFFLRGLAVILPPILTLLIIVWVCGLLNRYVLSPTTTAVRFTIAKFVDESRPADQFERPTQQMPELEYTGKIYLLSRALRDEVQTQITTGRDNGQTAPQAGDNVRKQLEAGAYVPLGNHAVPYKDFHTVASRLRPSDMPTTPTGIYMELVTTEYFKSLFHLSAVAIAVAIVLLYVIGRLFTARMGAWMFAKFESGVLSRVPLVSQVYSSVKQVTDFLFSERTVEYNRVVAVEYPRRGLWSIGFVTSDGFLEITAAAGEPMVAVLMPTSPMPMTGFTISVPRSEVLDLNITVDQAFQFCLSCGVLVPPQQKVTPELLQRELAKRFTVASAVGRDGHPAGGASGNLSAAQTEQSGDSSNPQDAP